jgi:anthranilate 1,2-dioxygenase (deaminating, decarboxylating) large subunit
MKGAAFFKIGCLLVALVFTAIGGSPMGVPLAQAYDEPGGLNLGLTSFLDGGPPAGPGFYFTQYLQYWHASKLVGVPPSAAGENLNVFAFASQFIYQSNQDLLLGGKWGLDFILPVIVTDLSNSAGAPLQDNGAGLGDIYIGPFLQWDPIMGSNGPLFMHRIELQLILPTGKYSDDKAVNPGSNFFSFDPYWAATLFITPKWEFSTRIHYLWNAKNNDPNLVPGADSTRAGQAVHLNFASSYEILEKMLRVGLNGYYLKQTTDFQVDGNSVPGAKEQVLGIGPGLVFHWSQNTHFFFNVYFETAVDNRPEGQRYNLRWVQHF